MEQLSPEWFAARCGMPTGSKFKQVITTKGKPSESRFKYMYQLAAECITGEVEETYQSEDMRRGTLLEPVARDVYAMENEVDVDVPFFYEHESGLYGCSADGTIGDDGLLEIKCPKLTTHIEYIEKGVLPNDYIQQVQGHMLVYSRSWCDFFSYYPKLPYFQIRVFPDIEFQNKLHDQLVAFSHELRELVKRLVVYGISQP